MKTKSVILALSLGAVFQSANAAEDSGVDFSALTGALNFDDAAPLIVAAGVSVVGWTIGKGAIMSVIGMISGAARR